MRPRFLGAVLLSSFVVSVAAARPAAGQVSGGQASGGKKYLDNKKLATSIAELMNTGKFSFEKDGAVRSTLGGGSPSGTAQRAEIALANVPEGATFAFGMTLRDFKGDGKVWQIIGPPWNGDPVNMSVRGGKFDMKGGKSGRSIGAPGTGPDEFVFQVKKSKSGFVKAWKNGKLVASVAGDLSRGQRNSRLRFGRYNRGGPNSSATGVYDKIWVSGLGELAPKGKGGKSMRSNRPSD